MPTRVVLRAPEPPQTTASPKAGNRKRDARFSDDFEGNETDHGDRSQSTDLSRYDISASHQLENYFICFACSVIDLVSYKAQIDNVDENMTSLFVIDWKEWGAYYVGIAGTCTTGFIMLVHFDKFFCQGFWATIFRAGSKTELVVVLSLFLFYGGSVYICTSPYSLGEVVPNVYFSAWVALASSVKLIDRWIKNTGRRSVSEQLSQHKRKTTKYWGLLIVFSSIIFFSGAEIYARRNDGNPYFGINPADVVDWNVLLPFSGTAVAIAIMGLVGNFRLGKFNIKCICCSFDLGWQQIESVLLLCELGLFSFGVIKYVGTQNFITRPSNPYFGLWGSLLNSILAIAILIKEHNFSVATYSKKDGLRFLTCDDATDD